MATALTAKGGQFAAAVEHAASRRAEDRCATPTQPNRHRLGSDDAIWDLVMGGSDEIMWATDAVHKRRKRTHDWPPPTEQVVARSQPGTERTASRPDYVVRDKRRRLVAHRRPIAHAAGR
jgi:hypothetical protein